jgi:hypothetical protein
MFLSDVQFGKFIIPKKTKPSIPPRTKPQNPTINEFLNLSIKQEKLRKLRAENKRLGLT